MMQILFLLALVLLYMFRVQILAWVNTKVPTEKFLSPTDIFQILSEYIPPPSAKSKVNEEMEVESNGPWRLQAFKSDVFLSCHI